MFYACFSTVIISQNPDSFKRRRDFFAYPFFREPAGHPKQATERHNRKEEIDMSYVGRWVFHSIGMMNEADEMVYLNAEEYRKAPMPYIDESDRIHSSSFFGAVWAWEPFLPGPTSGANTLWNPLRVPFLCALHAENDGFRRKSACAKAPARLRPRTAARFQLTAVPFLIYNSPLIS